MLARRLDCSNDLAAILKTPPVASGLFAPEELDLRPTGEARLRQLARLPGAPLSVRQKRVDEDRAVMRRLREWGAELAASFGLRYKCIDPEHEGVNEYYGICYEDGEIRIRLRHATTGRVLKESSLVDTLCHELAHLKHLNHGLSFRRLYQKILSHARDVGYYKPGPEAGRPIQGRLFGDDQCGAVRRGGTRKR